jgi:hypothetical protein
LSLIPANLAPRDSRRSLPQILRHALCGLPDDLEVADDRVLNHRRGEELVSARLGISERPIVASRM